MQETKDSSWCASAMSKTRPKPSVTLSEPSHNPVEVVEKATESGGKHARKGAGQSPEPAGVGEKNTNDERSHVKSTGYRKVG